MGTLFLIGNGFDLNCGLMTRYIDVYDEYTKTESESEIIERFKNLIDSDIANWSDFEIAMGRYAEKFMGETEFIQCANDFQVFMRGFLQTQEQAFYKTIEDTGVSDDIYFEMENSIANFYTGISNNINSEMQGRHASYIGDMSYVSFNYTSVFDNLIKNSYSRIQIHPTIHIHGTLEDPALGVDNEKQLIAGYPITDKLRRCFIKPFFNEQYDSKRIRWTESCINGADTICVFGMSLGLSDLRWRNLLIEWLRELNNRHLFLYDYECSCKHFKTISDRMNFEDDVKKDKLLAWDVKNYDELIDRFHIICGKSIFNVKNAVERKRKEIIENGKEYVDRKVTKSSKEKKG